jgi:hypothetical protein
MLSFQNCNESAQQKNGLVTVQIALDLFQYKAKAWSLLE